MEQHTIYAVLLFIQFSRNLAKNLPKIWLGVHAEGLGKGYTDSHSGYPPLPTCKKNKKNKKKITPIKIRLQPVIQNSPRSSLPGPLMMPPFIFFLVSFFVFLL